MSSVVFKQSVIDTLYKGARSNLERYVTSDTSWVEDLFGERSIFATAKLPDLPEDLLLMPRDEKLFDEQNAERLYEMLSGLTPAQAADPRLWTYLTHVKFWKYMRVRWNVKPITAEGEGAIKQQDTRLATITSRYFLVGDKARGLTRNGISRLWWAGYTCHAKGNLNQYAYAKALFAAQDVHGTLMERAFSKNRKVIQPVLAVLTRLLESGAPYDDRDKVRELGKHLVLLGGAMVLDVLDPPSIEQLVTDFISSQA